MTGTGDGADPHASGGFADPGSARQRDESPWSFAEEAAAIDIDATVTILHGSTFVICRRSGDITSGVDGVFVADTRVCHRLLVTLDGEHLESLATANDEPWCGRFIARSTSRRLVLQRRYTVGQGLHAELALRSTSGQPQGTRLAIEVAADLADLFAVKELRATRQPVPITTDLDGVLYLGRPTGRRAARLEVSRPPARRTETGLVWDIELAPHGEWRLDLELVAIRGGETIPFVRRPVAAGNGATRRVAHEAVSIRTDVPYLELAVAQALTDLHALRLQDPAEPHEEVVAAGAPWFMTLFGRDSIFTALMLLPFDPALALSTARVLARLQGTVDDPESEEQPGKILHEARPSHDVSLAFDDGELYYGSVDATLLFVVLVHELWSWGTPLSELAPLLPHVDAALAWAAGPGDPDGDGYVEYRRVRPGGLENQGWKDSWDGISFADGRLPTAPIALAEVQGYAYAAWRAGARLAEASGDPVRAAARSRRADELRAAFRRDFWLDGAGWLACGLDADKVPIDSLASNMGHCLWSGIVDDAIAPRVAAHLVDAPLASGWGVRTLATTMARYDPLSYHNGSVWPHDTAIAVAGLRRCGFVDAACRVARDLLAAAGAVGGRLPELMSGFAREEFPTPVRYPASCSPQAWASAAPLLVCRALLGLEPDHPDGRIVLGPALPPGSRVLEIDGLWLAGHRIEIGFEDGTMSIRGLPRGVTVTQTG
jgi:glycogen debranching enzyme